MSKSELQPIGDVDSSVQEHLNREVEKIQAERQNLDLFFSNDTLEVIRHVSGPIVEVGGDAQELLQGRDVLPSEPITSDIMDHGHGGLDLIADGKQLPFADDSVGMFMANHIGRIDFYNPKVHKYVYGGLLKPFGVAKRTDHASEWSEQEHAISMSNDQNAKVNLRINFLREMARAVAPNGLLMFGFLSAKDVVLAKSLGWEVVQAIQASSDAYSCLFRMNRK